MALKIADQGSPVMADREAALQALDYTCRYYLGISGSEFIERLDAGLISAEEIENDIGISRAAGMLSFARL